MIEKYKNFFSNRSDSKGLTLLILLISLSVMEIFLLLSYIPWRTVIKRELEKELIFRGNQYVEAIRIYQMKNPGRFPSKLEELLENKCIRKLYKDPVSEDGEWDIIVPSMLTGSGGERGAVQKIVIIPHKLIKKYPQPIQIIGVVSSSPEKSFKIYCGGETYNKWFFYYGRKCEIIPSYEYFKPK
jgi:competence protein ComGC